MFVNIRSRRLIELFSKNNMHLRCICTCAKLQASQAQVGRIVNKVMNIDVVKKNRNKKSSHNGINLNINPGITPSFIGTSRKVIHQNNRRVKVLNKLFMKHVTDLMATGEVASQLVGRGIEITHVKVVPDFSVVNVFWIGNDKINANEKTENILKSAGGHLQHELSQLRIIGNVPPIQFVKNKHYHSVQEIERRLSEIDFGEDYEPVYNSRSNSTIPILESSIPLEIRAEITSLDKKSNEEEENYEIKVPEMRQNVMGFDHAAVMKKVRHSLNKKQIVEQSRISNPLETEKNYQTSSEIIQSFLSTKEQDKIFDEFLKIRSIEQKRREKAVSFPEDNSEKYEDNIYDDDPNDIHIEEDYRDDYNDIESYK